MINSNLKCKCCNKIIGHIESQDIEEFQYCIQTLMNSHLISCTELQKQKNHFEWYETIDTLQVKKMYEIKLKDSKYGNYDFMFKAKDKTHLISILPMLLEQLAFQSIKSITISENQE